MSKKLIIAFEGVEGSGKSLHLKNISKYLKRKKIKFLSLREPGGSKTSEKIRKLILSKIILIDRFIDSTLAYQHYGMGIDKNIINKINQYLLGKIKIDFTFLNLVNMTNLQSRLSKRKNLNRYDKFRISFYKKVQNGLFNKFKNIQNGLIN